MWYAIGVAAFQVPQGFFIIMAKDPAFLFYSSDFLTGVSDLTMEERGQYITLLCLQHQKGRLTRKSIGIAVPNATADVLAKFRQDEQGNYYNPRLEIEADKRALHAEKQRQRALDGWEKRRGKNKSGGKATANATALPLEDINENEIKNNIKGVKFKKPEFGELKDYFFEKLQDNEKSIIEAEKFLDFYESKGWMIGKNKMKDWNAAVRNWCKKLDQNGTKKDDRFSEEAVRARMERW